MSKAEHETDQSARQVIREQLDQSLLVEAAAGTGKTTELVHRIASILARGVTTVDRIAAVTFTRKAAGELKLRLRQRLDQARLETENTAEQARLESATARLEEARIGTIHSFCAEILRERPVEAKVDPLFEELAEDGPPTLYRQAFESWMQQVLADPTPAIARAMNRKLRWDRKTPRQKLLEAGWQLAQWRDHPTPWKRVEFFRNEEIDRLIKEVRVVADLSARSGDTRDRLHQGLRAARDFIAELKHRETDSPRDYDLLESQLVELLSELRKWKAKGYGPYAPDVSRQALLGHRAELLDTLERFRRSADADLAAGLFQELGAVIKKYEETKARHGRLDFVDLLLKVRDMVRDDRTVRSFLQRRWTHIFVDEFQDTDPLQTEILLLLSSDHEDETDWRKVRPQPGKLFLVGDPKQSIYRFRRADVGLYHEVKTVLAEAGVQVVCLSRSFRATEPIQQAINLSFETHMIDDPASGQPGYVPLEGGPSGPTRQPSLIALSVPKPHGRYGIYRRAVSESLPEAIGAWIEWLLKKSGWTVRGPDQHRIPIEPRHIAILFRRYLSFGRDLTGPYTESLEARRIPQVLVGSRSFFQREEVEAIRAALSSIEWPEDELFAFATLRGPFFGFGDDLLMRWRREVGRFSHLSPATPRSAELQPVAEALELLQTLTQRRNDCPIVDTLHQLLDQTRALVGFALRPAGRQVLANIQRIADMARSFELTGGLSFRGFVEHLDEEACKEQSSEAPILEEGTDGVRLMKVHSAKGLEFPVVILADLASPLAHQHPDRFVDRQQGLAASRLLGCAPWELSEHAEQERDRDHAEGVRVAYVAATRARDLLVMPTIGEGPSADTMGETWISPLNRVFYPPTTSWRDSTPAPGCPRAGDRTVLSEPTHQNYHGRCIQPGQHRAEPGAPAVVWWDPMTLALGREPSYGLQQEQFLVRDEAGAAEQSIQAYQAWAARAQTTLEEGEVASMLPLRASEALYAPEEVDHLVDEIKMSRDPERPGGRRFGTLLHAILRDVDLKAPPPGAIEDLAQMHGRVLGATSEEIQAATSPVRAVLEHPVIIRARQSQPLLREHPLVFETDDGQLLDGAVDLMFKEGNRWTVVDFKTDADPSARRDQYLRQMQWYLFALNRITNEPVQGVLLTI